MNKLIICLVILTSFSRCSLQHSMIKDEIVADSIVVVCDKTIMNDTNKNCWDCEPFAKVYFSSDIKLSNLEVINNYVDIKIELDTTYKNGFLIHENNARSYRNKCKYLLNFIDKEISVIVSNDTIIVNKSNCFKIIYKDAHIPPFIINNN